jgi:hypothetical protein
MFHAKNVGDEEMTNNIHFKIMIFIVKVVSVAVVAGLFLCMVKILPRFFMTETSPDLFYEQEIFLSGAIICIALTGLLIIYLRRCGKMTSKMTSKYNVIVPEEIQSCVIWWSFITIALFFIVNVLLIFTGHDGIVMREISVFARAAPYIFLGILMVLLIYLVLALMHCILCASIAMVTYLIKILSDTEVKRVK